MQKTNPKFKPDSLIASRYWLSTKKGFTLIELLLYVSLAGILLFSTSIFITSVLESRVRAEVMSEVEGSARQAIQIILQAIRNAEAINSPIPGGSASSLSLDVLTPGGDPTVFSLNSGTIVVSEGGSAPLALTSNLVIASDLTFFNLSRTGTSGTIRLQFNLSYNNSSGRPEYNYSKNFIASATLRQ